MNTKSGFELMRSTNNIYNRFIFIVNHDAKQVVRILNILTDTFSNTVLPYEEWTQHVTINVDVDWDADSWEIVSE